MGLYYIHIQTCEPTEDTTLLAVWGAVSFSLFINFVTAQSQIMTGTQANTNSSYVQPEQAWCTSYTSIHFSKILSYWNLEVSQTFITFQNESLIIKNYIQTIFFIVHSRNDNSYSYHFILLKSQSMTTIQDRETYHRIRYW
jgi:hypothetical protein